jgi:NADH:ubiquinone oxidoreductase subunit 5 (subunit L)/multisubunit Na+/H+ antiporter MnhA subunit
MNYNALILSIVFIPIAGAFILPLAGWVSKSFRNYLSFFFILASFVLSCALIPMAISGNVATFNMPLAFGFNMVFTADALAVFMACVSSFISAIILLYSFDYISHYENQNEYYSMVVLFCGSMMGLVLSANLIFLFMFWELTAITSWRLIGFFRDKIHVLKADKAFLITVFGALMMLIGFIGVYQLTGSFDLAVIKQAMAAHPITNVLLALIFIGLISKSATLPFHTWLPDAGVAPSSVTALLHAAVLVKIGVYVYARLFIATFTMGQVWHTIVPSVALASALVSAAAAMFETDLKRLIAYSTVSQIGFIFFGLATGNVIGTAGGLLYILMHGLAKAGLFLSAGIIEQNTKTRDITKLGGLISTMPVTALSFLFCSLSVMGVPPFGGFFSKYMVFAGAIEARQFLLAGLLLCAAFMTIIYLFRAFNMIFLGDVKVSAKEGSFTMVYSVAALAVLSLLGGLFISYPAFFAKVAAMQMLGVLK